MDLQRLAVDAQRRGAVLIAKRNWAFRVVGFLEIKESTAMRLLERAVAMVPPGTLVEVIQISLDPAVELGITVRLVSYAEGMQILLSPASSCNCGNAQGLGSR
jgi:hypothetical protein